LEAPLAGWAGDGDKLLSDMQIFLDNNDDDDAVFVFAACDCEPLGVVDNDTSTCNADSGQCRCRLNITGRRCDECTAGSYGLMTSDPPGTCRRQRDNRYTALFSFQLT